MFKSDFDHVDIAVAAVNEKRGYLTPYLTGYWIVGIPPSFDSVTKALVSFFTLIDELQKCAIKLRSENSGAQKTAKILTDANFSTVPPQHKRATVTSYVSATSTTL
jgi:hypothetical protein